MSKKNHISKSQRVKSETSGIPFFRGGNSDGAFFSPQLDDSTVQAKSEGNTGKLPNSIKNKMEGAIGADFTDVKVHQNSSEAKEIGALAFTQGTNVHFAPGNYQPNSKEGQSLIGHELAHVKQQKSGKVKPTAEVRGKAVNDDQELEKEADQLGAKAAGGEVVQGFFSPGGILDSVVSGVGSILDILGNNNPNNKKKANPKNPRNKKKANPKNPRNKKRTNPKNPRNKKKTNPKNPRNKKKTNPKNPRNKKKTNPKNPRNKKKTNPKNPPNKRKVNPKNPNNKKNDGKTVDPCGCVIPPNPKNPKNPYGKGKPKPNTPVNPDPLIGEYSGTFENPGLTGSVAYNQSQDGIFWGEGFYENNENHLGFGFDALRARFGESESRIGFGEFHAGAWDGEDGDRRLGMEADAGLIRSNLNITDYVNRLMGPGTIDPAIVANLEAEALAGSLDAYVNPEGAFNLGAVFNLGQVAFEGGRRDPGSNTDSTNRFGVSAGWGGGVRGGINDTDGDGFPDIRFGADVPIAGLFGVTFDVSTEDPLRDLVLEHAGPLGSMIESMHGEGNISESLANVFGLTMEDANLDTTLDVLSDAPGDIMDWGLEQLGGVGDFISDLPIEDLTQPITFPFIDEILDTGGGRIGEAISGITEAASDAASWGADTIGEAVSGITGAASDAASWGGEKLSEAAGGIGGAISDATDWIGGLF